jgi:sulfur relay (sulfurtransferase) DsrC/TusE family protein
VYLTPSKKYVVKVPLDEDGYIDNIKEAQQAYIDNWLPKKYKARCKLMRNGWLVMEYVKSIYHLPYHYKDIPSWAYGVDACQIGFTLNGRLVAYDYAQRGPKPNQLEKMKKKKLEMANQD